MSSCRVRFRAGRPPSQTPKLVSKAVSPADVTPVIPEASHKQLLIGVTNLSENAMKLKITLFEVELKPEVWRCVCGTNWVTC